MKKKGNAVFGCPLEDNKCIPPIIRKVVDYFEENGFDYEGIFRVSGNRTDLESLKKSFDSGKDVDIANENPHVCSNLLKLYLRELPEPLLTFKAYEQYAQVAVLEEEGKEYKEELMKTMESMPETNRVITKYLISFLNKIQSRSEVNKMRAENLAIVFAPNILKSSSSGGGAAALTSSSSSTRIIELMIENFEVLFVNEPDPVYLPKTTSSQKNKEPLSVLRNRMNLEIIKSKFNLSPSQSSSSSNNNNSNSSNNNNHSSSSNLSSSGGNHANNAVNKAKEPEIIFKTNWSHSNVPKRQSMLKLLENELQLMSSENLLPPSPSPLSSSQSPNISPTTTPRPPIATHTKSSPSVLSPTPSPPLPSSSSPSPLANTSPRLPPPPPVKNSPLVNKSNLPPVPPKYRSSSSVPVHQNMKDDFNDYKRANSPLSLHRTGSSDDSSISNANNNINPETPYRPVPPPRKSNLREENNASQSNSTVNSVNQPKEAPFVNINNNNIRVLSPMRNTNTKLSLSKSSHVPPSELVTVLENAKKSYMLDNKNQSEPNNAPKNLPLIPPKPAPTRSISYSSVKNINTL